MAGGKHSAQRRRRVLPSGDHWARGLALRAAGRAPHPTEQAAGRGEVGNYGGDHLGGGRSSGNGGDGATGHGRANPWVLQVHRSAASTLVMLGRAAELRSTELVGNGGGELRCSWGMVLRQPNGDRVRGK